MQNQDDDSDNNIPLTNIYNSSVKSWRRRDEERKESEPEEHTPVTSIQALMQIL